jgi:hypothetical protein
VRALALAFVVGGTALSLVGCGATGPAPAKAIPDADPGASRDPINRLQVEALRDISRRVLGELVAALPAEHQARVRNIPLFGDDSLGDVNAYASCADDGTPFVAISDGLLQISAHLAMSVASDEVFETDKRTDYLDWLEHHALEAPPVGFYYFAHHTDRTKIARQREVFEEEVAYILGHELAHHYLGHLACNSKRGGLEELGQVAADEIPVFSQAGELAADVAATKNVLNAGAQRASYAWTENGALLVIAAFNHRRPLGVRDVLLGFERTHPIPHLRAPAITTTAELWRGSGGYLPL